MDGWMGPVRDRIGPQEFRQGIRKACFRSFRYVPLLVKDEC